jgi:hypothetical protein
MYGSALKHLGRFQDIAAVQKSIANIPGSEFDIASRAPDLMPFFCFNTLRAKQSFWLLISSMLIQN